MRRAGVTLATIVGCLLCGVLGGAERQQTTPFVPKQSDRPTAIEGDEPGFTPIFDGKSLNGWEGDPKYWRVEDGALVGEITPETVLKSNTFIIWRGGRPRDFELKLDYRITPGGNSGINYRSESVPDPVTPANTFALRGYQFDLDGGKRYVGNNYEEKGRLFVGVRGQITRIVGTRPPVVLATLGEAAELAAAATDDVECGAPQHPRQHAGSHAERPGDERHGGRRHGEPADRRPAGRAGARRPADEGGIPQHPVEELVASELAEEAEGTDSQEERSNGDEQRSIFISFSLLR